MFTLQMQNIQKKLVDLVFHPNIGLFDIKCGTFSPKIKYSVEICRIKKCRTPGQNCLDNSINSTGCGVIQEF